MTRSRFNQAWMRWAKQMDEGVYPDKKWLDFQWANMGVDGRLRNGKEFEREILDNEGVLGELLFAESEALRN